MNDLHTMREIAPLFWLIELDALQEPIARLAQWLAFGGSLARHPPPHYGLQAI